MGILGSGGLSSDDCEWRRGSVLGLVKPLLSPMPLRGFRSEEESVDSPGDLWAGQQERAGFQEGYATKKTGRGLLLECSRAPSQGPKALTSFSPGKGRSGGGSGCLFSWEQVGGHSMNQTPCGSLMPELRTSSAGCWRGRVGAVEQSAPPCRTPGRCPHPSSHAVDGRQRRGYGLESEGLVPRPSVPPVPSLCTPRPLSWLLLSGPRPPQAPCIPPSPRPDSGLAFLCPGMSTALRQVPVRLSRPRTGGECAFCRPASLP